MNVEEADEELETTREPTFRKIFYKYINKISIVAVMIIILTYIYFQINLASLDNKSFTSKFLYNIFAIVLPVIGVLCFVLLTTVDKGFGIYIISASIFAIALFGMGFYFLQTNYSQYIFNKYLLYVVIVFGIIIALSIIATLFSGTLQRQAGWTGFFANLLFYIPCLIRDGIRGILNEYKTFSTTLMILFGIELLILLMYFFLIPLLNNNVVPTNISLLDDPVMLNMAVPLSVAPIYTGSGPWNNFSISMWVYVNPAPNTKTSYTKKTPIFSYVPSDTDNYFTLNYENNKDNQTLFNLDISNTVTDSIFGSNNPISLKMELQRWNNIVFNVTTQDIPTSTEKKMVISYGKSDVVIPTKTTVDIFLNGELIQSSLLNSTPVFSPRDMIKIGSGKDDANINGLYGAICNIVYYREPLTRLSLIYNYNKLVINNPPV